MSKAFYLIVGFLLAIPATLYALAYLVSHLGPR